MFNGQHLVAGKLAIAGFSNLPESKPLVLGVRPDDLRQSDTGQLKMRIDIVEQHGADNLIYGALLDTANPENGEETEFCFKADQDVLPALDSELMLEFDTSKAMIFEQETGQRLL